MVILFSMNAVLTGIFLLRIPPIVVLFMYFVRRITPISKSVQQKLGTLNTILQENLFLVMQSVALHN